MKIDNLFTVKSRLFLVFLGVFLIMFNSNTLSAQEIKLIVEGIDVKRGGNIMALLYSKEGFPKNHAKAIEIKNADANSSTVEFTFEVNMQNFALKILHDEDKTGQVSKNWTGLKPSEGLGFSNGAKLRRLGPPNFEQARLNTISVESEIVIKIIYPR